MSLLGKKALVPTISGAEDDFLGKNHARWFQFNPRSRKWLKRKFNHRVRINAKKEIRNEAPEVV